MQKKARGLIMPVKTCPTCGYLIVNPSAPCPSCGAEIPISTVSPPSSPVVSRPYREQSQYVNEDPQKFSIKTIVAILCVVIIVALAGGGGFYYYKKKEKFNKYVNSMIYAASLMLNGSAKSEEIMNMVAKIWYNSIHKEHDSTTDKYTRLYPEVGYSFGMTSSEREKYDYFVDFNMAILGYYADSSSRLEEIKKNQELVMDAMRDLQNPPEGCQAAYDTISEIYKAYTTLIDMATNPSGSLQTYSTTKNIAVSAFTNLNKQLATRIPEKR